MPVSLHQTHNYRDFHISFTEMKDEPALLIGREGKDRSYVIFLGMAYKFADLDTGDKYLIETAIRVAELLEIDQNRSTVKRIADAILNHLEELVKMPPAPIPRLEEPEDVCLKVDGDDVL